MRVSQACSTADVLGGAAWQKKLRLSGLLLCALNSVTPARILSVPSMAQGSDPRPPAFATATAISTPVAFAIGA